MTNSKIQTMALSLARVFTKQNLKKGLFIFTLTFVTIGFTVDHVKILRNTTTSLPGTYFLYFPKMTPKRGDLTTYAHTNGLTLMKRVIGIEGDVIRYDARGFLYVNNERVGKPHPKNSQGEVLHAIPAGVIPKGHVFLYASHPQSLDSRYTEVGLIYHKHLSGKAFYLF